MICFTHYRPKQFRFWTRNTKICFPPFWQWPFCPVSCRLGIKTIQLESSLGICNFKQCCSNFCSMWVFACCKYFFETCFSPICFPALVMGFATSNNVAATFAACESLLAANIFFETSFSPICFPAPVIARNTKVHVQCSIYLQSVLASWVSALVPVSDLEGWQS